MRDFLETIVWFLIVAVLLLKTFVAEAYVIPTGSMATTLWGAQKIVHCPECGHTFPVNASSEVEPQQGDRAAILSCICPNCRYAINFEEEHRRNPSWPIPTTNSGDRILVSKSMYDLPPQQPRRQDVVVFRFPDAPQKDQVPTNYIKRLIGLPGETIGIYYGRLYAAQGLQAPTTDPRLRFELRQPGYMYTDADVGLLKRDAIKPAADQDKRFHILRKSPAQVLARRRLVYDNDQQAADLVGQLPPRWTEENSRGWMPDDPARPKVFTHAAGDDGLAWLHYRHILRGAPLDAEGQPLPELITDFLGYNTGSTMNQPQAPRGNWVGDLLLECKVKVEKPEGELWLELRRGVDRFQARFQLDTGTCTLFRGGPRDPQPLATQPTRLKRTGEFQVCFANVDERLLLWVDGELPFGSGVEYDPPKQLGPEPSDRQPAGIGARGAAVTVAQLKLWRDNYYTLTAGPNSPDAELPPQAWSDPDQWDKLRDLPARTMYVQPDHYLCLGDNSQESADSRQWGTVPRRLLLGRALLILYPFSRAGMIH